MSLIAWYPLNGNTNDYSGNSFHSTSSGLTYAPGKIGQAGSFNGSNSSISSLSILPSLIETNISFWFKWNSFGTDAVQFIIAGANETMEVHTGGNSGVNGLRFIINTNPNSSLDVLNAIPDSGWNHYSVNYNNSKTIVFRNGIEIANKNYSITTAIPSNIIYLGRRADNTYFLNGLLNDIRIYNTNLSEKEIKEIAKAKILHYSFDDFQEPTTNLVPSSNLMSGWVGYSNGNDGTFITEFGTTGYQIINRLSWNGLSRSVTVPVVGTYTFSALIKYKNSTGANNGATVYVSGYGSSDTATAIDKSKVNQWQRVSITFNATNTTFNLYLISYGGDSSVDRSTWNVTMPQLEFKEYMTNYTPTYRLGTINDNSGFRNNITLVEATTPQWVSDSKIGSGAYKFNGTSSYLNLSTLSNMPYNNGLTFSCWAYPTATSTWARFMDFGVGPASDNILFARSSSTTDLVLISFNGAASLVLTAVGVIQNNVWQHFAFTISATGLAKIYKNGILLISGNIYVPNSVYRTYNYIGKSNWADSLYTGLLDDIRVYTTEFSDTNIFELYQTRASVDNTGNLYSTELIDNGIGNCANNKIAYWNWEEGDYSSASKTFNGIDSNHNMQFDPNINFSTKVIQSVNPLGLTDRLIEFKSKTTHYVQYAHPTSYYYFTFDATKTYRYSQWIYRDVQTSTNYTSRCYLGIAENTVCSINTTTLNGNPYFTYPTMDDAKYMNKWVLQVFYIYPYGSTGNPTTGTIYYRNRSSVSDGFNYNWANVSSSYIRQYPMYEYGEIAANSYVLHYRPRLDIINGTEPSINELLSCGEHLPLITNLYNFNKIIENGNYNTRNFSETGITKGLIAYYPFDKNARDYSGNGNHGTVSGAVLSNGIKGRAYSFNYANLDSITISAGSSLSVTTGVTLSAWVKSNDITKAQNIISRNGPHFLRVTNSTLRCGVYTGTWIFINGSTILASNTWYHLVLTYDGEFMKGYINGALEINNAKTGLLQNYGVLKIGYTTGGEDAPFDGIIDEVRIYNRALSAEEVSILYETTAPSTAAMKITKDTVYLKGEFKEVI